MNKSSSSDLVREESGMEIDDQVNNHSSNVEIDYRDNEYHSGMFIKLFFVYKHNYILHIT